MRWTTSPALTKSGPPRLKVCCDLASISHTSRASRKKSMRWTTSPALTKSGPPRLKTLPHGPKRLSPAARTGSEWPRTFSIRAYCSPPTAAPPSQNQHAIAVGVKAVFRLHGVTVGRHHQIFAAKGADQKQQTGAREVEVRQHRAGLQKGHAGIEKDGSFALELAGAGGGFQRAYARRAHRHHAPRGIDCRGVRRRDAVMFGVQLHLFDGPLVQRLKSPQPHV